MSEQTPDNPSSPLSQSARITAVMRRYPDAIAIGGLILLWLIFFWRLLTPIAADQVSIVDGDFSRQFITFGAYQFERLTAGEIPLWNPYNNGGLPFIADTQAAVFYPPRLITIALTDLISGEWTYNTLQIEMMVHVLLLTLFMYAFVRRLTIGKSASYSAGLVAAIIAGYGGFTTGYPPLQLALLEAAVWLPLALIGVLEATRDDALRWRWLALAGCGLGISWMAGHPQTSWFATYTLVAYVAWRVYVQKYGLRQFITATLLMGLITLGTTAVHLLPSAEYLGYTMRQGLSFDAKSGGFPPQDVIQFIIPGSVSLFSPLYIGVLGLALAGIATLGKHTDRWFFLGLGVFALAFSLGGNSSLFHLAYNIMPGAEFFRGQERAAYLVMIALATLAGLGVTTLADNAETITTKRIRRVINGFALVIVFMAGGIVIAWFGDRAAYGDTVGPATFSAVMIALAALLYPQIMTNTHVRWRVLLVVLVAFEITSVTIDSDAVFEAVPASERTILETPYLVQRINEDSASITQPFRVEGGQVRGEIGIYGDGNTGSAYKIADIRGISPLFLDGPHALIQREPPIELAWELFAVRYIFTDAEELLIESELIARDYPDGQTLNLHRLADPRPFALLLTDFVTADDDAAARDRLRDPEFNPRTQIVLQNSPDLELSSPLDGNDEATITEYTPETFTVEIETTANALLSLAHVDYPGWHYDINGESVDPIRANGGLVALPIPAGEHTLTARYQPLSFTLGAALSLVTWAGLAILGLVTLLGARRHE